MMFQEPQRALGKIVTFYSYKGGTGRTMALANTACLLAQRGEQEGRRLRILVVDWDFEAPGLHRYFLPYLDGRTQRNFDKRIGCLDFFTAINRTSILKQFKPDDSVGNRKLTKDIAQSIGFTNYVVETKIAGLSLMKAGMFDDDYGRRVAEFDWVELFEKTPGLFAGLADYMREEYDYVLIDSRTGVSDTSGICTCLLPDILVSVFTPNAQSLSGLKDATARALRYRQQSADWRPLIVFPLPSRVETARPKLLETWRHGSDSRPGKNDSVFEQGFQPLFERVFTEAYELEKCDLTEYFNEVQIQHIPDYAYGEPIAVLTEKDNSRIFLRAAYSAFVDRLTELPTPWTSLAQTRADANVEKLIDQAQEAGQREKPDFALRVANTCLAELASCSTTTLEHVVEGFILIAKAIGAKKRSAVVELLAELARIVPTKEWDAPYLQVEPLTQLAKELERLGAYREALVQIDQTLTVMRPEDSESNDSDLSLCNLRINLLIKSGKHQEAVEASEAVVKRYAPSVSAIPADISPDSIGQLGSGIDAKTITRQLHETLSLWAKCQFQLGQFALARTQREITLAACRRILGDEHPETLMAMDNLAVTLHAQGDLASAFELEKSVLAARRCILGDEHPDTLTSMNNLAEILHSKGNLTEAFELEKSVLAIRQRTLGDEHPDTLTVMNNLASTLKAQGDLAGALDLQRSTLATQRRILGDEHPETLASMNNLANVLYSQNDLAGALDLQKSALAIQQRILGNEHPDTLMFMNNLASTLWAQGDLSSALELERSVLAGRLRIFGKEHPTTLQSMNNLASTLYSQGDLAAALDLQKSVLEVQRRILGDEHPATLTSMNNLASTLKAQGDPGSALDLEKLALAIRQRTLGDEHPDTLTAMGNIASTLYSQGDLAGALDLQKSALAIQRRTLGDEHPDTLTTMNNLASTLKAQGDLAGALDLLKSVLTIRQRTLGDEHPDTLISAWNMFATALQLNDTSTAKDMLEKHLQPLLQADPTKLPASSRTIYDKLRSNA